MPAPTINDFHVFSGLDFNQRYRIVKGYFLENKTMVEVAMELFPFEGQAGSQKVSVVTRCYGFGGENHGVFRRWGIADYIEDSDIMEFVRQYPDGCSYDGNGIEMRQFLSQLVNKRRAQEEKRKQQEQAARVERLRIEAETRRIEAEERHRREEIERKKMLRQQQAAAQKAEKERKLRDFLKNQATIKNSAITLMKEAEKIISSASDVDKLKLGIEKYRQAMEISWSEIDSSGHRIQTNMAPSKIFLEACTQVVTASYNKNNYEDVLQFGHYVCPLPSNDAEEERFIKAYFIRREKSKLNPEITCLTIISMVYFRRNMIQLALKTANLGYRLGSIGCMELLGDYYYKSDDEEDIYLAVQCFEQMGKITETDLQEKRDRARKKLIAIRSREVEQVLNVYNPNWLIAPAQNNETWEKISNLVDSSAAQLIRNRRNVSAIENEIIKVAQGEINPIEIVDDFKKLGYQPGTINLKELWKYYKTMHSIEEQQPVLKFFKKKRKLYDGELAIGDFVDCCKYLWLLKYFAKDNDSQNKLSIEKENSIDREKSTEKEFAGGDSEKSYVKEKYEDKKKTSMQKIPSSENEVDALLGQPLVTKVISETDIKYNICTLGAKFHVGFGEHVTIIIDGKEYEAKMHNSVKGRLDGIRNIYSENNICQGDTVEAEYYPDRKIIQLRKLQ